MRRGFENRAGEWETMRIRKRSVRPDTACRTWRAPAPKPSSSTRGGKALVRAEVSGITAFKEGEKREQEATFMDKAYCCDMRRQATESNCSCCKDKKQEKHAHVHLILWHTCSPEAAHERVHAPASGAQERPLHKGGKKTQGAGLCSCSAQLSSKAFPLRHRIKAANSFAARFLTDAALRMPTYRHAKAP